MYTVMKEFNIAIAHRLLKHKGKCFNLHGHNLKIQVFLSSEKLNDNDMVIDFYDIKKEIGPIVDSLDHKTILNYKDTLNSHVDSLSFLNDKDINIIMLFDINNILKDEYNFSYPDPTSESIAKYLHDRIYSVIFSAKDGDTAWHNINKITIRIHESSTSMAEYSSKI